MFLVDKMLELAVSQGVDRINNVQRVPTTTACTCGAGVGRYHNIGCQHETCPICSRTLRTCGCSHD